MQSKLLLILLATLFSQYVAAEAHNEKSPAGEALAKSERCIECHQSSEVVLRGQGVETITAKIVAIRAGDARHPPGVGGLREEEIAEVAEILDRGSL
jgi:mono/diheme cytochrome c family protein